MIHFLLMMFHSALPAKVGLAGSKFMGAGIVGKANVFGHHMVMAQANTAAAGGQFINTAQHTAARMAHTAKSMAVTAENGLAPMGKLFSRHGWQVPLEIGEAGLLVAMEFAGRHQ